MRTEISFDFTSIKNKINRFITYIKNCNPFEIYILIIIHLILIFSIASFNVSKKNNKNILKLQKEIVRLECMQDSLLAIINPLDTVEEYVLFNIMKHEGFRSKPYKDVAGNLTIGYGHLIKEGERFKILSEDSAKDLLRKDFQIAKSAAIRLSPILKDPNNIFKLYAISHFIFGKGSGNYANSTLRQKVNNNKNVDNEFRKWVKVTINGRKLDSKHLMDIAEWRIELYNKEL
jgi:lysozyme